MSNKKKLQRLSNSIRFQIIHKSYEKKSGHLGGSLSCVDLLVYVFNNFIFKNQNNTFILSKGHCALALYATLYIYQKLSKKLFNSFANKGSFFGEHPSPKIKNKFIEFSTGSLGHGLSFASGIAYANKLKRKKNKTFVLMSDGEMNCGSVWESALLSSKLKLDNLIAIIDYNKFQATGKSNEILSISPLAKKWQMFGWETIECDGNNQESINNKLQKLIKKNSKKPKIIIANTIKGKGIKFMENDNNWHYRSPTLNEVKISKNFLGIK